VIDDAASRSWGPFVKADAIPQKMAAVWEDLEKDGRIVDVYTDRDSMFTMPVRPESGVASAIATNGTEQECFSQRWMSVPA
jgi:hypothetical protein